VGFQERDVARFMRALRSVPPRQGRIDRLLRVAIRGWCTALRWRIEVDPLLDLPAVSSRAPGSGCVIAGAPHRSWVEPFLLVAAWPPDAAPLVWLADGRTVLGSWWRRRLLPRLRVIPIQGSARALPACAEAAAQVLAAGAALVVFPETGPPSAPDHLRAISPGFAYLAMASGAPIVPLAFGGTHAVARGSTFSVSALDSIDAGAAGEAPFSPAVRARAHAIAERFDVVVTSALRELNARTDARR
jgi:1-acyl-sn-glycerol-3-phosphate acyltransferase